MANIEVGPLYAEIGQVVADDLGLEPVGTLLFAQAGDGWSGAAIFQDVGTHIIYRGPSLKLASLILKAWKAEDEDKRWSELHYRILDGRFEVNMIYPEQIDIEEDSLDRRDRIVREKFGDKPIDYSDP